MDNPEVVSDLCGVYHSKCIAAIGEHNFKYSGSQPFHGFCYIGHSIFGCNGQCGETDGLSLDRKLFKVLARRLYPRDRPGLSNHQYLPENQIIVVKYDNIVNSFREVPNATFELELAISSRFFNRQTETSFPGKMKTGHG